MLRYLLLILLLWSSAARADITYNGYSLVYGTGVTILHNGDTVNGGAGLVALDNVNGFGTQSVLNVWCVDDGNYLQSGGSFVLTSAANDPNLTGPSPFSMTSGGTKISDIAAAIYSWATGDAQQVLFDASLDEVASAVQTIVWATEYATSEIVSSTGKIIGWTGITIIPSDASVIPDALHLMNSMGGLPAVPSNVSLDVLTPPGGGNQTMALIITGVPEPGSILVLLSALGLLFLVRIYDRHKITRQHS